LHGDSFFLSVLPFANASLAIYQANPSDQPYHRNLFFKLIIKIFLKFVLKLFLKFGLENKITLEIVLVRSCESTATKRLVALQKD